MSSIARIYAYQSYKEFLSDLSGGRQRRSGFRAALARALRCTPTFVNQVLYGNCHFSLEQADGVANFLQLGALEKKYLFLLILKDRSGTDALKGYFESEMSEYLSRKVMPAASEVK